MPKDTKTLGNNKAWACESLGFVHKKRLCQRFDTTSCFHFVTQYNKMKTRGCVKTKAHLLFYLKNSRSSFFVYATISSVIR